MNVQPTLFDRWPAKRYLGRRYRRNDQPWQTAIHESGHAVLAHLLNVPFQYVTIRPSLGGVLGHVATDFTSYLRAESETVVSNRVASVATVLVAGSVASARFALIPNWRTGSDYSTLDRLLGGDQVPVDRKHAVVLSLEQVAENFLASHAIALSLFQLALALTKRITLDHATAVCVMAGGLL